jgi:hypothetical protein
MDYWPVQFSVRAKCDFMDLDFVELLLAIAAQIAAAAKRNVLVIVEDLDKIPLDQARRLFSESYQVLVQPAISVIYTVPVALYFSSAYTSIGDQARFLPNVKLHSRIDRKSLDEAGYATMREFVHKRMEGSLIATDALDEAIRLSGGIFRELSRVMQMAASRAALREADQIELEDVREAESRIRNDFRRMLTADDRAVLRQVWQTCELRDPERLGPLFHLLAAIEYKNSENWCDVHPALAPLLEAESGTP